MDILKSKLEDKKGEILILEKKALKEKQDRNWLVMTRKLIPEIDGFDIIASDFLSVLKCLLACKEKLHCSTLVDTLKGVLPNELRDLVALKLIPLSGKYYEQDSCVCGSLIL